ncbi:MAG: hypothetical protein QM726_20595 [Chitinophagaceae bacterium]
MSLNEMNLPISIVTDLYKNHLVENSAEKNIAAPIQTEKKAAEKKGIQFLGKNQKRICLLVNYAKDVYLPDDQLNFLTAILQACKLNLGDVAIINHHRENLTFDELRKQITCNYLIIFGVTPELLTLQSLPPYSIQNINDCYIVYSEPAELLNSTSAESKVLKSKLWACLKQLFNV